MRSGQRYFSRFSLFRSRVNPRGAGRADARTARRNLQRAAEHPPAYMEALFAPLNKVIRGFVDFLLLNRASSHAHRRAGLCLVFFDAAPIPEDSDCALAIRNSQSERG